MRLLTPQRAIGCALIAVLVLVLGFPLLLDVLFGAAYCLDGYGCPWD